jgi:hypothetical protein
MAHMKQTDTGIWYLADDWHIDDVLNIRPDLSEAEALKVLEVLADDFDANNGINWDVIQYTADRLYEEPDDDEEEED